MNESNYYRNISPKPATPQTPYAPPKPQTPPTPYKPPKPKKPPKPPKKKFDLKCLKKDTCKSLNEVECFLNNFSDFVRYTKLIFLLKKKK